MIISGWRDQSAGVSTYTCHQPYGKYVYLSPWNYRREKLTVDSKNLWALEVENGPQRSSTLQDVRLGPRKCPTHVGPYSRVELCSVSSSSIGIICNSQFHPRISTLCVHLIQPSVLNLVLKESFSVLWPTHFFFSKSHEGYLLEVTHRITPMKDNYGHPKCYHQNSSLWIILVYHALPFFCSSLPPQISIIF